ncbi:MAG: Hint domain-containing protein [Chloroflexota bacterium]
MLVKRWLTAVFIVLILGALAACQKGPVTPPVVYSQPELEYRLIANFGDVFYCDPDYYPVAREGQEEKNALEQFPAISANTTEFSAILAHLGLPDKTDYTDQEKLSIYREHKKLTLAAQMTAAGDVYNFTLRVGEGQGERIEGTISTSGVIRVTKREPSFNTCPICLAAGTLIDTPDGPVSVEQLRQGMAVWTVDASSERVVATVIETVMTSVPPSFQLVKIQLSDGRTVTASSGHPTAEGLALGSYQVGKTLDGAQVESVEQIAYDNVATYDLLPSGETGLYWANGILLKSTLASK